MTREEINEIQSGIDNGYILAEDPEEVVGPKGCIRLDQHIIDHALSFIKSARERVNFSLTNEAGKTVYPGTPEHAKLVSEMALKATTSFVRSSTR